MHPILPPFRADLDRLQAVTVCLRPFRARGPRIEAERLGDTLVVHNYGHGGSGWSLSWGSAAAALDLALAGGDPGPAGLAVIGCGALGLTSAVAAQRRGLRVTIYTRDLPHETRSARATGSWTPESRVALATALTEPATQRWEQLCRTTWAGFAPYVNAPGDPVTFHSRYTLCGDRTPETFFAAMHADDPIGFATPGRRVADLYAPPQDLSGVACGLPGEHVRCEQQMIFNISEYTRQLFAEFTSRGGQICRQAFAVAGELCSLPQRVIVHAAGFGARQLFGDSSVVPVRGQIAWLPAQLEADYSVFVRDGQCNLNVVSRRDGLVVQMSERGEATGWDTADERPDAGEAERAISRLAAWERQRATLATARLQA